PAAAATETPPPQAPVGLPTEMPVQASFSISGTVTGADGQGLPGVAVSDDQGHQVQTAADGSYSLEGLAPGDYAVRPGQGQVTLIPTLRVVHVVDKNVSGVDFYPPKAPLPVNAAAQPMPTNYQHVLAAGLPASQGDLSAQSVYTVGQPGTSYTYLPTNQIGTTGEPYELQSVGAITQLNAPSALALDASGKLVEVEEHGNRLVRFNGPVSDLEIGNKPGIAYMDNYVFNSLTAVAVNPANGHYWVGDSTRLVEYDPSLSVGQRFISQMPSTNPWESGSDPNHFTEIRGIAFNTAGPEMYVSDRFNHRIQMYDISGSYPSYTGTIGVTGAAGSDNAHFNEPWGITFYNNYLYVADSMNHRIQKCDPIAFTCVTYLGGAAPLPGSQQIYLKRPTAISFNATYAFIADAQNEIVARCNLSGAMACTLFAGTAGETGVDGSHLNWPLDVVASATLVYVADQNNQRILLFNPSTAVFISTIGTTSLPFVTDDTHLDRPWGLAIDTKDNNSLYVGENWGYSLAKFDSDGEFEWRVPANPGTFGSDLHHFGNFQGGNQGNLAVDASHRIYVPDAGNSRVMIYKSDGSLFGQLGSTWGSDNAHLACPQGVAVGTDGKIYVADTCNQRVQVFDASLNYVTTIGVTGQTGTDGGHFNQPAAVSIDNSTGNLFVADQANDRVQKCHPTTSTSYACTPFAGSTGVSGNVNFRYLNSPSSVLVDPVYKRVIVADDQASRVQVFDMNGAYLTTLGGEWGEAGGRMRDPSGLAVDSNGDLFVADRENARVQVYLPYETFWTQLNVNGFGEQFNGRVDGLAYFTVPYKGSPTSMLYVTTVRDDGNPPTPGAAASSPQVWRMLPDYTWQAVSAPGFGDSANTALVDLAAYNGDLYAGTFNVSGAQIWRCPNANPATPTNPCAQQSDWTQVTMPWGQPSPQFSIADRMMEFKPDGNTDLLAVSMMNYYSSSGVYTTSGGEVWL
ncbi:MAG: carboxypeptidase regulatory-like domain-containing protein, partial [Anaerolineaceae bacterium]